MTLIGISLVIWYRIPTGWFEFNWMVLRVWNTSLSRTMAWDSYYLEHWRHLSIVWHRQLWFLFRLNPRMVSGQRTGRKQRSSKLQFTELLSSGRILVFWNFVFHLWFDKPPNVFMFSSSLDLHRHLFSYLTVLFLMPQNRVKKKLTWKQSRITITITGVHGHYPMA